MNAPVSPQQLKPKDYASDQDVRWCPGCGDYAILKAVQRTLADIGARPENTVFVSGIGCAARFPYYVDTYGFHTIHGRAPAIATGTKLANPELDVWLVTGDGDALSIGGNHMLHLLRRNVDLQVLLFNNQVYGLTKGQYSPTSNVGMRSPSTPHGSTETPVNASVFALGAGARFIARSVDTMGKHLPEVLKRAHAHRGASFVEIFQNCIVYNDGIFESFTKKASAADNQLHLEHGKPLLFGKNNEQGLRLNLKTLTLDVVSLEDQDVNEGDIVIHDETNATLAGLLARLPHPVALGVLYNDPAPSFEALNTLPGRSAAEPKSNADLNALLRKGHTWRV